MFNRKGLAEVAILLYVIGAMVLFFVPNPVSTAVGIGIKPNKTVQTDATTQTLVPMQVDGETVYHKDGSVALVSQSVYKKQDLDIQQHVTFWEWLKSLPIFVLFLMALGVIFPPVAGLLAKLWMGLKKETKVIVHSVNAGLAAIDDADKKQDVLTAMSKVQNESTKQLVADLKKI